MKHNRWHFWYCTIIVVITTTFLIHADQDSYSIVTSGGSNQQSPLDATLDSFKSSTTRALKTEKKKEDESQDIKISSANPEKKKGWFRKQIDKVSDYIFDPNKKKKTLRNMELAELETFKDKCLVSNDRYNAIRTLERMVPICTDLEKLKSLLLELADLLFDDGKLEAAGKMYREFVKYYPGNIKVEYALYKAILCKFQVILDAERDQSNTRDTVELANKFLEREEIFITHAQEVRTIRAQCYERLLENEIKIFDFYINRGRYKSARTRLTNIRKEFIDLIPACDPYLITLEIDLAQHVKDMPLIEEKQKELTQRFPDYQRTTLAQTINTPKSNTELI